MSAIAGNLTEAAARYGVTRWTAQKWVRSGLPYIKTGAKSKLILFATLDKWMESRQTTAKGAKS